MIANRMMAIAVGCCLLYGSAIGGESDRLSNTHTFRRVMYLGNSITLHAPATQIGWEGNWGMAASAADRDYVHLLQSQIEQAQGIKPESYVQNIADFERGFVSYDFDVGLKDAAAFHPDLIFVAIGENVAELSSEDQRKSFRESFGRLLDWLKKNCAPEQSTASAQEAVIVVRGTFWHSVEKNELMRATCDERGVLFVALEGLDRDPKNAASSERKIEHAGVGSHPGDRGMQAIAQTIWAKLQERYPMPKR